MLRKMVLFGVTSLMALAMPLALSPGRLVLVKLRIAVPGAVGEEGANGRFLSQMQPAVYRNDNAVDIGGGG